MRDTKHVADVYSREHVLMGEHILTVLSNPNVGHKKHFADVYSKLNVFALSQFDKVSSSCDMHPPPQMT